MHLVEANRRNIGGVRIPETRFKPERFGYKWNWWEKAKDFILNLSFRSTRDKTDGFTPAPENDLGKITGLSRRTESNRGIMEKGPQTLNEFMDRKAA